MSVFSYFFGYFLFTQTNKEPVFQMSGASSQVETVDKDRIDKVLEDFSTRQQKSNQILNSFTSVVDPSL